MDALRRRLGSWTARPARFFGAVAVLAAVAAGAEHAFVARRGHPLDPATGACWIWAEGVHRSPWPVAFYAVRDFVVDRASRAEVTIAADEVYALFLDGRRLGANGYRRGAPADRYAVGEVAAGRHRLVVELRSSRGAGGLLAALRLSPAGAAAAPSGLEVVTDGSWRIYRRHDAALFDPGADPGPGEAPAVWQRPPTGRWRVRPAAGERPLEPDVVEGRHRRFPQRVRRAIDRARWMDLEKWRRRFPDLGSRVLLDWGREVVGYLEVDVVPPAPPGLVYFGPAPPDPGVRDPDEVLVFVSGSRQWRSAHVRRFRYVLLAGVRPRTWVRVLPVEAAAAAELGPPEPNGGVFGIRPAHPREKLVEEIWRRVREGR